MADFRAAILNAVLEADRLHKQFNTEARSAAGAGRIDVFDMFVRLDIPLMFQPFKGLLGAFMDDPCPGAMVTTQRQLTVQRFTAAHELGHALLGHKPSLDDEGVLSRMPFVGQGHYDLQEMQANAFASELLMPRWLVAKHMDQQSWGPRDLQHAETMYQLSLRLGASYKATCHSLICHKVIDDRTCQSLLATQPRTIKQRLSEPYEPPNWYGDVWVVTDRDDGMLVEGSRSDLVVLNFAEHSGSGYLWHLDDLTRAGLVVVSDERAADQDSDVVGGIVSRTVIVEAQDGARGTIDLREVRPWQAAGEPLHSLKLKIDLFGPTSRGLLPQQRQVLLGAA